MENYKILKVTEFSLEVWDWKTGRYVADITNLVKNGFNMEWVLNDTEELSFSLDLIQFRKKCEKMGVKPEEVLSPYIHDIRVRRNGQYIMGCQVVETNITVENEVGLTLEVRCTGFLNLFKDAYLTRDWNGFTYAQLARKLVETSQKGDSLIQNSTFDINDEGWITVNGRKQRMNDIRGSYSGQGHLRILPATSGSTWATTATRIQAPIGTKLKISLKGNAPNGRPLIILEREMPSKAVNQREIGRVTGNGGGWQNIEFTYETIYDYSYLVIEFDSTARDQFAWIDEVTVVKIGDDTDMKVSLGLDTASPKQNRSRQRAYSMQAVKEALTNLTTLENDNFDFEFTPDRIFNCYDRKGRDKPEIQAVYPGNIHALSISRSASNLANKVTILGSGIGDERIEVTQYDNESINKYGVREKVITANNVSLKSTLKEKAIGELWDRKKPTDLPSISIEDGSINSGNIQVGDSILVKVEGDDYLDTINGMYRIVKASIRVGQEHQEAVTLTLEPPVERPIKKTIRYIKNTLNGSEKNNNAHWVSVQALELVGNAYVDRARGKSVTQVGDIRDLDRITNGNLNSDNYAGNDNQKGTILIDLGAEYPIDHIKIHHYYADNRKYRENVLSVGKTSVGGHTPLETILWDFTSQPYAETDTGMTSKSIQEIE